jgi:hypothetical protein
MERLMSLILAKEISVILPPTRTEWERYLFLAYWKRLVS